MEFSVEFSSQRTWRVTGAHPTSTRFHIHVSGKKERTVTNGGGPPSDDVVMYITLGSLKSDETGQLSTRVRGRQCSSIQHALLHLTKERCLTQAVYVVFCSLEVHTWRHPKQQICCHLQAQFLDKQTAYDMSPKSWISIVVSIAQTVIQTCICTANMLSVIH